MKLNLTQTETGILLPVKAKPNSGKNELRGSTGGTLKVAVSATAEKGRANKAIVKLLARVISIPKGQIVLATGGKSCSKKFLIKGIEQAELQARLQRGSTGN